MTRAAAIIVAAGSGIRFGGPKQHSLLGGKTVLERTLAIFQAHDDIGGIVLVTEDPRIWGTKATAFTKVAAVVKGGRERQDSVWEGMAVLLRDGRHPFDLVLVHDGVRPLVGSDLISRVVKSARRFGAACPAVPLDDTIKRVEGDHILHTEDRTKLVRVQTPQGFALDLLKRALEKAREEGFTGTDESILVERLGEDVILVPGDRKNIKITTPRDIKIAEALLND
jgi:2-C-methyl-D-erythritol 4-phosphate cytidylyltransferase